MSALVLRHLDARAIVRRAAWPVALYLAALGLRIIVALLMSGPASPDAAFYASLATNVAAGRGLNVDFLWNFSEVGGTIPPNPTLPVPAGGHWLPGAALVQVPLQLLFGPAWLPSAITGALLSALAAPVGYLLARDLRQSRAVSIGAGALLALGGPLLAFLVQSDGFALSISLGALALLLCGRAARGSRRSLVGAAMLAAAMALTRNDGLLYLVPLLSAAWLGRARLGRRTLLVALAVFGALMLPWWLRQLAVFGTLSPSIAAGRSLWIISLSEFDGVGRLGPGDLLAHGLPAIALSRLTGAGVVAVMHGLFLALGGLLLVPAVGEMIVRRRQRYVLPALLFGAAFVVADIVLFAPHLANGMYLRSGSSLAALTVVLGLAGLERLIGAIARRRSHWNVRQAMAMVLAGLVMLQAAGAAWGVASSAAAIRERSAQQAWLNASLARLAQPEDVIMAADAATTNWATGYRAVVAPESSLLEIGVVAHSYRARWLLVDRQDRVSVLAPLLDGGPLPDWVDGPVAVYGVDRLKPDAVLYRISDWLLVH